MPVVRASTALREMRNLQQQRNVCVLVTDAEPDDMLAILLLLMSGNYKAKCGNGVKIALVWQNDEKRELLILLFKMARKEEPKIFNGATSVKNDKDNPFDTVETDASKALYDILIEENTRFHILIIAPCRDLTIAVEHVARSYPNALNNIHEIHWAGGWDPNHYKTSYNLYRDIGYSIRLLQIHGLSGKISISSKQVSVYRGSMGSKKFPQLIDKLVEFRHNTFIDKLLTFQYLWDTTLLRSMSQEAVQDVLKIKEIGTQFCPADILAAMIMFNTTLIKKTEKITYKLIELPKEDAAVWPTVLAMPIPAPQNFPKKVPKKSTDHGPFTSKVIWEINDSERNEGADPKRDELSEFKKTVMMLLENFLNSQSLSRALRNRTIFSTISR